MTIVGAAIKQNAGPSLREGGRKKIFFVFDNQVEIFFSGQIQKQSHNENEILCNRIFKYSIHRVIINFVSSVRHLNMEITNDHCVL